MKISTKMTLALSTLLMTTLLFSSSVFENSPRCEKKLNNLQEQIKIAKSMDNSQRVEGLEISLSKVKKYCSDDKLIEEIKDKISDTEEDLSEHTQDYKEALRDKRSDKMQKYQSKIDEDKAKLKNLQDELNN